MDHISLSSLVPSQRQKDNDCKHHAHYGHTKPEVGDVCQLQNMELRVSEKIFMDIEDMGKVCQMITRALCVCLVVTDSCTPILGPDITAEAPEGT